METDQQNADVADQGSDQTDENIEAIEITASSPEPEDTTDKAPTTDVLTPKPLSSPQVKMEAGCISLLAEIYRTEVSILAAVAPTRA